MIINIRGTHGSGKSTLVRRVKEMYGDGAVPQMLQGRKQPFGYMCRAPGLEQLYIPGHYVGPCGGCDSISSIESIFGSVITAAESGVAVLFEGIVAQHSATRLLDLHMVHPVKVIALSTTLEECIESVVARRVARGQTDEFDPKNVAKEFRSVLSSSRRLTNDGLPVEFMSREEAFNFVHGKIVLAAAQATVIAG